MRQSVLSPRHFCFNSSTIHSLYFSFGWGGSSVTQVNFWGVQQGGGFALLASCLRTWHDLCLCLWFLFAYITASGHKSLVSSLTQPDPWFACFCQAVIDLAAILTDFYGNAETWLPVNSFISCNIFSLWARASLYVRPFNLKNKQTYKPLLISDPFLFLSLTSLPLPSFFCMLLPSLAWNGDWKPPKVWRNCKSQKQPAQQPCKSTRNSLWKGQQPLCWRCFQLVVFKALHTTLLPAFTYLLHPLSECISFLIA